LPPPIPPLALSLISPLEYPSWKKLSQLHSSKQSTLVLKDLFAQDPKRFETYSKAYKASTEKGEDVEIFLDYSKNLLDEEVWKALLSLAKEASEYISQC
jgi:glucose-6-phosphate isomerase